MKRDRRGPRSAREILNPIDYSNPRVGARHRRARKRVDSVRLKFEQRIAAHEPDIGGHIRVQGIWVGEKV
jgi:hypothetical protein